MERRVRVDQIYVFKTALAVEGLDSAIFSTYTYIGRSIYGIRQTRYKKGCIFSKNDNGIDCQS